MVAADWVRRVSSRRALELTESGADALRSTLGIDGDDLRRPA
jgi:hypothetical protein